MNDARLTSLIHMAGEIDALEHAASSGPTAPALRLVGAHRQAAAPPRSSWSIGLSLLIAGASIAAAACLGLMIYTNVPETPRSLGPVAGGDPSAATPMRPEDEPPKSPVVASASSTAEDDASLVLAIVTTPEGELRCVKWSDDEHTPTAPAEITPSVMAATTCKPDCVVGPHWLIAARISAPRGVMPTTSDAITRLAHCILVGHPSNCESDVSDLAPAMAACLPINMNVSVQTKSMSGW